MTQGPALSACLGHLSRGGRPCTAPRAFWAASPTSMKGQTVEGGREGGREGEKGRPDKEHAEGCWWCPLRGRDFMRSAINQPRPSR